jgi:hypothetical protein
MLHILLHCDSYYYMCTCALLSVRASTELLYINVFTTHIMRHSTDTSLLSATCHLLRTRTHVTGCVGYNEMLGKDTSYK